MTITTRSCIRTCILVFAICMISMPLVLAADPGPSAPGQQGPGTGIADNAPVIAFLPGDPEPLGPQVKEAAAEPAVSTDAVSTPALVSPENNTHFYNYPRTVTLSWMPVANADQYKIERYYKSGATWVSYPAVYVTGNTRTSYTFNFVGDQYGRWRVSAIDNSPYAISAPSGWRMFYFTTAGVLPAPTLISPINGEHFYNWPRNTTLAWKVVPGATAYRVERAFYSSGTWIAYPVVTTPQTSYTFNFVGMQPGRWRVTAIAGTNPYFLWYNSPPTAWWTFTYHV